MADGGEPLEKTVTEPPLAEESMGGLFRRLIGDAKTLGRAEAARIRALVLRRAADTRWAVILAVTSLFIVQAAVTALAIGLLLVLAGSLGIGWATVIVTVGGLIVAGLLVWIALRLARGAFAKEE